MVSVGLFCLCLAPWTTAAVDPAALFARLDLSRAGLEAVQREVAAGQLDAAAVALRAYYRQRAEPAPFDGWPTRPAVNPTADVTAAEAVLRREYRFVGKPATLTADIDWNANPHRDHEWPIELNRHGTWVRLARAWWETDQDRFIDDLVAQVLDWAADNPRPAGPSGAKYTWRTLECGIRLSGSWPETFFRVCHSDRFEPAAMMAMLELIAQQAEYLSRFHGGNNWYVLERCGLLVAGLMFPEFTAAEQWRDLAWRTLQEELAAQVLPDGAQVELTPHYHGATLSSFQRALDVAVRAGQEVPREYRLGLEAMYQYLLLVAKPSGHIPMFNDSDHDNVRSRLARAGELFDRDDFRWMGSSGQRGTRPEVLSVALPHAGQYVMRTGWEPDSVYLALDAGPYGTGHQHEDKLTFDLWAHGTELLVDPGRYTYAGPWRGYFVSTRSHTTILPGGRDQRRRATSRGGWVARQPLPNRWQVTDDLEFVTGAYEDGWTGAEELVHVRKILFVKPRYFVVADRLVPAVEASETTYEQAWVQFQTGLPDGRLLADELTYTTSGGSGNLLIAPAAPAGTTVTCHTGEEDPAAGWIGWSLHRAEKKPATMVRYQAPLAAAGALAFETVLLPYPGDATPALTVERVAGVDPSLATALRVSGDGWSDLVVIRHDGDRGRLTVDGQTITAEVSVTPASGPAMSLPEPRVGEPSAPVSREENSVPATVPTPRHLALRYGYANGGGWLYQTAPTGETTGDRLAVPHPRAGVTYRYEALASDDLVQWDVLEAGTLRTAPRQVFDFDDGESQGWDGNGLTVAAPGWQGSPGCLRLTSPPTSDVAYLHATLALPLVVSPETRFELAWRAPLAEGGEFFYIKLQLVDSRGLDWSAYFANRPRADWARAQLDLSQFRGDTRDTPEYRQPLPVGTRLVAAKLTFRKGPTSQPVAPLLEVDSFAITP